MNDKADNGRHPFRFLFRLGVLAAFFYFAMRLVMMKKDEYYGLSESEAREKMTGKLEPRIGAEKANEVADQVIPLLKDRGLIKSDPMSEAGESVDGAADEVSETVPGDEDDSE